MLIKALITLAAFAVALVLVSAWIFYDFGRSRRRATETPASAERIARLFLLRLSVLVGLVSGAGMASLLATLMSPAPNVWILLAAGVGDTVITAVALQVVIRVWPRFRGTDPLAEIRRAAIHLGGDV